MQCKMCSQPATAGIQLSECSMLQSEGILNRKRVIGQLGVMVIVRPKVAAWSTYGDGAQVVWI